MTLTCPKCHGAMRTYERNGVHVDQCTECRGIFLDRGELEKLIDAENRWHGETPAAAATPPAGAIPAAAAPPAPLPPTSQLGAIVGEVLQQARGAKSSGGGYDRGYKPGYKHKKKKSFLDELFD